MLEALAWRPWNSELIPWEWESRRSWSLSPVFRVPIRPGHHSCPPGPTCGRWPGACSRPRVSGPGSDPGPDEAAPTAEAGSAAAPGWAGSSPGTRPAEPRRPRTRRLSARPPRARACGEARRALEHTRTWRGRETGSCRCPPQGPRIGIWTAPAGTDARLGGTHLVRQALICSCTSAQPRASCCPLRAV